MSEIIQLQNLSFSYRGRYVLKDINLSVQKGDFLGIIGPNGGGKTTLIRIMLGMITPDSGTVRIFNKPPRQGREHVGYLSQYANLDLDFPITVYDIVLLSRLKNRVFTRLKSRDHKRVAEELKRLNLWQFRHRKLNELSGGEKQRVFIARALAKEPQVLILDEPIANVDMKIQEEIYGILQELNKDKTIIVVDHDIETLQKYAKQIACINRCIHEGLCYHEVDDEQPLPQGL